MHCNNCGQEINDNATFCQNCGTPVSPENGDMGKQEQKYPVPSEYKPISMWGYFGYEILFAIPIVGFILLIIFSFVPKNKNLKNFARSYFCFMIVLLIIGVVLITSGIIGSLK